MTLIDLFREFSQVSTAEGYPQSSRILFYTVMYLWNERRRPEVLEVSTEKLYTLAGLKESTFRDALKYLTDRYWMKRVKSRNRGITALWLRDRRENTAPPAGFPMTPAQRRVTESVENPPQSGFSHDNHQRNRDHEQSIQFARTESDNQQPQSQAELQRMAETHRRTANLDSLEMPDD